jgi:hypothetical protein
MYRLGLPAKTSPFFRNASFNVSYPDKTIANFPPKYNEYTSPNDFLYFLKGFLMSRSNKCKCPMSGSLNFGVGGNGGS